MNWSSWQPIARRETAVQNAGAPLVVLGAEKHVGFGPSSGDLEGEQADVRNNRNRVEHAQVVHAEDNA